MAGWWIFLERERLSPPPGQTPQPSPYLLSSLSHPLFPSGATHEALLSQDRVRDFPHLAQIAPYANVSGAAYVTGARERGGVRERQRARLGEGPSGLFVLSLSLS